jgi:hypothetical protein
MVLIALPSSACLALGPDDFLLKYELDSRRDDPAFAGFSLERGKELYFSRHRMADGSDLSCASCHHQDPRREQFAHHDPIPCRACHGIVESNNYDPIPKIKRQLLPISPLANADRFTNEWQVERWFGKNCRLLLQRECTSLEKGDFLFWLMSVK